METKAKTSVDEASDLLLKSVIEGDEWPEMPSPEPIDVEVDMPDPSRSEEPLADECWAQGANDFKRGLSVHRNPYEKGTESFEYWQQGWMGMPKPRLDRKPSAETSGLNPIPEPHIGEAADNLIEKVLK